MHNANRSRIGTRSLTTGNLKTSSRGLALFGYFRCLS